MNYNVEFKGFEPKDVVHLLIEDLVKKLKWKAQALSADVVFLRLLVEENSARHVYYASVTLELTGKTLATKEEEPNLELAIKDAFAAIERQLEKHVANLRGEPAPKRPAGREPIREMNIDAVPSEQRNREMFFSLVNPHRNRLLHFARHALDYARAMGDVIPGELEPKDVVDAAMVRAYREFVKGRARGEIRSWLIKLVIAQLETEVKSLRLEHNLTVHIEEDIPETPPTEEVSTLGDEILDFYQPDEDLKLEDIVPDLEVPTPEQETETEELRACVKAALAGMPREWRRALLLRHVEELAGAELAKAIGRAEPEIDRILEHARQYLRQRLMESGCSFKGGDSRAIRAAEAGANSEKPVPKQAKRS